MTIIELVHDIVICICCCIAIPIGLYLLVKLWLSMFTYDVSNDEEGADNESEVNK